MFRMPSQLTSSSASKAPVGDKWALEVPEVDAETECEKRVPIATTVIRLNNFAQWASSGSVVPYLSVYFLHYTQATPNDVGIFVLISAIVGIFVNFSLSSLADRYQAHRAAYISMLTVAYVAYSIMLIPILITPADADTTESLQLTTASDQHDTAQNPASTNITTTFTAANTTTTTDATSTTNQIDAEEPNGEPVTLKFTIDQQNAAWFYLIGICVAVGNMSSGLNMNFSDSFSANAARSAKDSGGPSFGMLRLFAAIGWVTVSLLLSIINQFQRDLPYLMASWVLFLFLGAANMLLVFFWPDKRPFDLAEGENILSRDKTKEVDSQQPVGRIFTARMGRTWPLAPCWPRSSATEVVRLEDQGALAENQVSGIAVLGGHVYEFDSDSFDGEMEHRQRPDFNARRCSIAPLGNSYICEQFVIVGKPTATKQKPSQANGSDKIAHEKKQHFKYIAKIEPVNKMNLSELRAVEQQMEVEAQRTVGSEQLDKISFKLYLKILELIARRNRNVLRFMLLYIVFGFIISLNWVFLFPYLEQLDAQKFKTVSAWVMMSSYFSEMIFYFVSARVTRLLNPANGLSFALLMFAARYACYLAFADAWWPLELIVLVEMMQSVTLGWFECVYNESALEFALEAERCVPRLIELGLIPNTRPAIEKVRNSVKLTLFSLSSCCFDGFGIGLGSLLGGWLIDRHGFCSLWTTCVCLALAVCLLNVLVELSGFPAGPQESSATATTNDKAEKNNSANEKT